jgi:hypothetical protein
MVVAPRSTGARLQEPTTRTSCVSPRRALVYTQDKENQAFLPYDG